ncbi:MAG: hypothetical protein V3T58_02950 [Candidatus Hydrothermarchaeales archaeon]
MVIVNVFKLITEIIKEIGKLFPRPIKELFYLLAGLTAFLASAYAIQGGLELVSMILRTVVIPILELIGV